MDQPRSSTPDRDPVEVPEVFGRDHTLVGSVCLPATGSPHGSDFVVFLTSGIIHRSGPNRNYVRLARALALHGLPSLRFDLSGIGDSIPVPGSGAANLQDSVKADIDDALELLASRYGAERFVVVGLCSGADNALRTIARDDRVVGAILLDLNVERTTGYYLRHYARRALRISSWLNILTGRHPMYRALGRRLLRRREASTQAADPDTTPRLTFDAYLPRHAMREHLERVVGRGGELLCVFTAGLAGQYNYRNQFLDLFPDVDFEDRLRLEYFADSDHTFSRVDLRERLTRTVLEWIDDRIVRGSPAES